MNAPRPAPYPADTRAKGWRFELDLEQIRRSTTWGRTKPEARAWLFMLWAVAWEQAPCGSLPDDREAIAGLLGIPEKLWEKQAEALMRGWWLADDGRLYHDTLAVRVAEMTKRRRSDSDRQAAKRERDSAASAVSPPELTPLSRVTPSGVVPESSTDNRQPKKELSKPSASHPVESPGDRRFARFWAECPRKVGKDAARKAFDKRKPDDALTETMIAAMRSQCASPAWLKDDGAFIPHPATWLNEGRWKDEGYEAPQKVVEVWRAPPAQTPEEKAAADAARIEVMARLGRTKAAA